MHPAFLNNDYKQTFYDKNTRRYIVYPRLNNQHTKGYLSRKDYEKYVFEKYFYEYFQKKMRALNPRSKNIQQLQRDLLPRFYRSTKTENIFGLSKFDLQIQGTVQLKTGILYQRIENPQIPVENQTNMNLDFDQQIAASLNANFGEVLQIKANYDTQSTFDFQNVFQINFNPNKKQTDKDAILQDIDVGNINMITNNNLIPGAQDLFGVKTKLRFGNTNITAVLSRQKSQTKTIIAQSGGTRSEFDFRASEYDSQRHFFLAHYFRNHYNKALATLPLISGAITIRRVEVWVTNTTTDVKNTRNILALADLGESGFDVYDANLSNIQNNQILQTTSAIKYPQNANNTLGAIFSNSEVRYRKTLKNGLPSNFKLQKDYVFLNNARKLDPREYTFHKQLGILSLREKLPDNAALAVAFRYTVLENNTIYTVGEFATDVQNTSENVIVKLLRTPVVDTKSRLWDLMLKNRYQIGGSGIKQKDFRLEILYRDDPTGVATNTLQNTAKKTDRTLLNLMGLDVLNQNGFPKKKGDGHFDYLQNITIYPKDGIVSFPLLEPFGRDLQEKIGAGTSKYIFKELYTETQNVVQNNFQNKDKYLLKGYYTSDFKQGIPLGVMNPKRGSVKVTSNGIALKEGIDYSVDYVMGIVKIVNPSIALSGNPIKVSLENTNIFQSNNRTFIGVDLTHNFSDKFLVAGTYLNLSERPASGKVRLGKIPINNSMYGLSFQYNDTLAFVTDWVNKLPFTHSKKPTTLNIRGDFAYLKPDVNVDTQTQESSTIYIDDFEDAQITFDMANFRAWQLASKPLNFRNKAGFFYDFGTEKNNDLDYGKNRAKLAWYSIDRLFYENTSLKPSHISNKDLSRAEISPVFYKELFPNKQIQDTQNPLINTFDLAYYPRERGSYNYDDLDAAGFLAAPEKRWAGITRALPLTNFQKHNIMYLEFWLQDPYEHYSITPQEGSDNNGKPIEQGTLFFNLGNISEDILKDGEKQYENGLSTDANDLVQNKTVWGNVPSQAKSLYAFDDNENHRALQDVGLDGLNDAQEKDFFKKFKNLSDPSADNYRFFRSSDYDKIQASVLQRYKDYNNTQGNAAIGSLNPENYPTMATTFPDAEDLDKNQTMNTLDGYYQYEVSLAKTDWVVGKNHIVDIKKTLRKNPEGSSQKITWYQFRIPLQNGQIIGEKPNWNYINFLRIFLTQCKTPVVLRFATLKLVKGSWRVYEKNLHDGNISEQDNLTDTQKKKIQIGTVSIEENENKKPIAYVLPPNISRERVLQNTAVQSQNEQSLSMKIGDMPFDKTIAVYKNVQLDIRVYKRLKMFIHAESVLQGINALADGQISAVLRMGTDLTNNFYQIQIPLKITQAAASDPEQVWPEQNQIHILLEKLANLKIQRSQENARHNAIYFGKNSSKDRQKMSVKGFPSLSDIRVISLGIRNTGKGKIPISAEVWFNELRVEGFKNKGGWAATLNANANISDVANIDFNTQIQTDGFGDIEKNITQRNQFTTKQYALATRWNIEKLLPQKWRLRIPMHYNISEVFKSPIYDFKFQDLLFKDTKQLNANHQNSLEHTLRKSINFINVGKRAGANKRFYHLENLTASYSYNEFFHKDYRTQWEVEKNMNASLHYNYAFSAKPMKPFSKLEFLDNNAFFKWIKKFHFNLKPSTVSVNAQINRNSYQQKYRNLMEGLTELPALEQRNFLFNWDYTIGYRVSKGLNVLFKANNYRVYDRFENGEHSEEQPDLFYNFFEKGRMKNYIQNFRITYNFPFSRMPLLNFINVNYSYDADFSWHAANPRWVSKMGNTLKNTHTQKWNALLNLSRLYFNLKIASRKNIFYTLITMIKNIRFNFLKNSGTQIQGFKYQPYFMGVPKKNWGYTPYLKFAFGNQSDIRAYILKDNGFAYRNINQPDQSNDAFYNKSYQTNQYEKMEFDVNIRPLKKLNLIISAHRKQTNYVSENVDPVLDHQNQKDKSKYRLYFRDTPVTASGSFSMSYNMAGSFFENPQDTFIKFLNNRKKVQKKIALQNGWQASDLGINSAAVLIPALRAAYANVAVDAHDTDIFLRFPKLNWQLVYSGFTELTWIKKYFSNLIVSHRYTSSYGIQNYQNNLAYKTSQGIPFKDKNGKYQQENIISNIYLNENFAPLLKLTVGFKNNITLAAQMDSSRTLQMNLDNYTLSDTQAKNYTFGLGYFLKNVKVPFRIGSYKKILQGNLNIKMDVSYRTDLTLVRNIQTTNTEITGGQSAFSVRFLASYNLNKNLNASVYYNHLSNAYAISTSFPDTSVQAGVGIIYRLEN